MTTDNEPQEHVIDVQNISKMYRIYNSPQERLKQMLFRGQRQYGRDFWALHDISFQIPKGESVGIIGRNGSGKSTLLQIIAGTLAPTEGSVRVSGRVAALLELGSGFNPEFTGRDNVYLNGSILGVSHEEMDALFDEIATFADIGDFIDQPVKLYSSGMAVRLAFAVQAMVQKDVLIVDEALAVGDEAFQRKCMRKLEEFRESGGTVLLVSHSAQAIVRQCSRCLFLHDGHLVLDGPSKAVTDVYQRFIYGTPAQQHQTLALLQQSHTMEIDALLEQMTAINGDTAKKASSPAALEQSAQFDASMPKTSEVVYGTGEAEIFDAAMVDLLGNTVNVLTIGQEYIWRFKVRFLEDTWNINLGMMIRTVEGIEVAGINTQWELIDVNPVKRGDVIEMAFHLHMNLGPATYYIESGCIGSTVNGEGSANFLHRRVDIMAIRVITPDSKRVVGIAYLKPSIHVS